MTRCRTRCRGWWPRHLQRRHWSWRPLLQWRCWRWGRLCARIEGVATGGLELRHQVAELLAERRRREAVALVESRVHEIEALLSKTIPESGVLTGSATCAEVRLADTDAAHRYLRVAFMARRDLIADVHTALCRAGFEDADPGSDMSIIQIAHANGRRPHYVVCDGSRDRLAIGRAVH